jgi:hypothetical protein
MKRNWSQVQVGDVVLGARDRQAWEVVEKSDDGTTKIQNSKGRGYTFVPFGEVDVIATGEEISALAEVTVRTIMPGSVEIMRQDKENGLWVCPNAYPDAGVIQAHSFVLHGKRLKESPLPDMMAEHNAWHEANDIATPHIHTKDWRNR